MTTAIYMRVSTDLQTTASQSLSLKQWCEDNAPDAVWFSDEGMSGADNDRPQWNELYERAMAGDFDRVVVWKKDRISRDMMKRLYWLLSLRDHGVEVVSLTETECGDKLVDMLLEVVLSYMGERDLEDRRQRTKAGIAAVKASGQAWGGAREVDRDKKGVRSLSDADLVSAERLRGKGESYRAIGDRLGVSPSCVMKSLRRVASRSQWIPLADDPDRTRNPHDVASRREA